jgi:short subunit dehydrogenase-like uncharacterized protein
VTPVTIVLYGATGYTGRLVARELAQRGLDHVLSGRDPEKLARLGGATKAVALDDDAALRDLLEPARVVINCAGPFTVAGDALVRAAIATGTHYVDSTGEQPFIKMVFDRHSAQAERAGVALVPALGFDYTPGDCIARLTAQGHEPLEELVIAYAVDDFGMSRGTLKSALEMMKGGELVYAAERWQPAPAGVFRASFDFPEPIGRQPVSRLPAGEIVTVPHHTRTRKVTALITTRTIAPAPLSQLLPFVMPGVSLTLRTPLRGLLARGVSLLPEGPSEEDRPEARFTIVAEARGQDGTSRRGVVRGKDVYGLTAVTLVAGAELMSAPGFDRSGALGPAAAFDPAALMNRVGLSWQVG